MREFLRHLPLFMYFCGVVALDQVSKVLVLSLLFLHESLTVVPGLLDFTLITNTGAAFGMLAGEPVWWRLLFFITAAMMILVFLGQAYLRWGKESRLLAVATGLIAGGAVSNILDRLYHGAVIDFIDFYYGVRHWPAFNVADSAITAGAVLFAVFSYHQERRQPQKGESAAAGDSQKGKGKGQ